MATFDGESTGVTPPLCAQPFPGKAKCENCVSYCLGFTELLVYFAFFYAFYSTLFVAFCLKNVIITDDKAALVSPKIAQTVGY